MGVGQPRQQRPPGTIDDVGRALGREPAPHPDDDAVPYEAVEAGPAVDLDITDQEVPAHGRLRGAGSAIFPESATSVGVGCHARVAATTSRIATSSSRLPP